MEIKNKDLRRISEGLKRVKGVRDIYASVKIAEAKRLIDVKLKDLSGAKEITPSESLVAFEKKVNALAEKHSIRDDKGNPKSRFDSHTGQMVFDIENMAEFQKELAKIESRHKDEMKEREEISKNINDLMEQPCGINFQLISISSLEKAGLDNEIIDAIFELIDTEETKKGGKK